MCVLCPKESVVDVACARVCVCVCVGVSVFVSRVRIGGGVANEGGKGGPWCVFRRQWQWRL